MALNKKPWAIMTGVFSFLLTLALTGTYFANSYASMINKELNISSSKVIHDENVDEDTEYFKSDFLKADGTLDGDKLTAWQKALCEQIQGEGSVLVENKDKALPLTKGASVTCFGRSSADIIYGGTGSGQVDTANAATMAKALKEAGFKVNEQMLDWYSGKVAALKEAKLNRSTAGMWTEFKDVGNATRIAEIPANEVANSGVSYEGYKDVAIVTIGRSGGEGADLAFNEFTDGVHYFELQEQEKELLKYVASQDFSKIVVLINSSNAMALDWLNDSEYKIDACLWIGGPGQYGMNSVAKILCGDINPSGKFVDTYSASSLSSPAMQNFGGYDWANADPVTGTIDGVEIDGTPGDKTKVRYAIHYLVEQESIYVGYKYYETRYEDSVLGQGNANGSAGVYCSQGNGWNYTDEVNYAFGYGLSYTDFEQKLDKVEYNRQDDTFTLTVTVKNTGSVAGKDVVQVYGQQPYTEFDRQNKIEKAAVQLVGFGKTNEIAAGKSETIQVTVDRKELAVYDEVVNKTYILEDGTYYLAIGDSSHDALNNILAAKGKTKADGMDAEGNADNAYSTVVRETDATAYAYSDANVGYKITNQFEEADLNYYGKLVTYLSRQDWQGTYPTSYDTLKATPEMIQDLQFNYTADTSTSDIVYGSKETSYNIVMMRGRDFDDELWEPLLNQLTLEEMAEIVGHSGYGTQAINSISLPATVQADGPQGIKGQYAGSSTIAYTSEPVMAATFNVEILHNVGLSMGEDALRVDGARITGWYGPAMNIHRTPYSGRNFEYYSEDGFLSGKMAAAEVSGAREKGLCVYIKHFAMNDQETYRQAVATFNREQAFREIYLKGFQYAVEEGGANAAMTSFNRIGCRWAGAHKGLLTNVLRNEWGFVGVTLTDAVMANRNWMDVSIGVEAGNDTWLSSGDWLVSKIVDWAQNDSKLLANVRESCHRFLYVYVNTTAVNGISSADRVVEITPAWQIAVYAIDVLFGVLALGSAALLAVSSFKKKESI
ncbi:MAG: glycoside hydrolase family 3 protein [Clostridia bacterium]|nr:glycoside hydrolase family 3 protein [Clostridia bacterium]